MKIEFLLRRVEVGGVVRRFRIYVPPGYEERPARPPVLFLHGAGERGNDSLAQTTVGIGPALRTRDTPYPAIVVFPQCPRESHWSAGEARAIAMAALDEAAGELGFDPARVALTGISMGAAGAWLLAWEQPERFVSLSPICGWVSGHTPSELQLFANRVARIPTWIFHGEADNVVPVDESRALYEAMQAAGANVRYTELAGVGHNSWDPAYQGSELMDWMINQ